MSKIDEKKTYFISENYKFLGSPVDVSNDLIYYSDDIHLVENRSKNPNSYNIVKVIPINDDTQTLEVDIKDEANLSANVRMKIEICKIDSNKFIIKEVLTLS